MKMKPLSLEKIAAVTGGKYIGADGHKADLITGVVRDNRQVQKGNLFLCIRGERVDGHSFANSAFDAGAAACLAEHEIPDARGPYILVESTLEALKKTAKYYRSLFSIPFVGVTGSVGKTTAKEMVSAVLSRKYKVLKTPENLNNEIGVPLTVLSLREEHEAAVIEMGISDFSEMSRLADIVRPDICLMTTVGYCHLENLGDLNGVLRAKSEVFSFMKASGVAVVNGDNELLSAFDPGMKKITFGLGEHNDFIAKNIENCGFDGISCDIVSDSLSIRASIPAFGVHMALSALAAAAIGTELGVSAEDIRLGLTDYAPVGGRANIRHAGGITVINDCYNANPNSVAASLTSLCSVGGRRVAILGDMNELGGESAKLHEDIGKKAAQLGLDVLLACGTLSENTYNGFISAGGRKAEYFRDKASLISGLASLVSVGDTVLVKASHSGHFEEIVSALEQL